MCTYKGRSVDALSQQVGLLADVGRFDRQPTECNPLYAIGEPTTVSGSWTPNWLGSSRLSSRNLTMMTRNAID